MTFGLIDMPLWGYVVVALVFTHVTILGVTIYLHRHACHRALDLHPVVSHFFRFWLWMSTGMETKEWVAIHRKHHAKVETAQDPHSPQVKGIKKVFWEGAELYREEKENMETMDRYGHGTPDDWLERNVYVKHSARGIQLMLVINVILFGWLGLTIWALQMAWIPVFAAGIINGIGHWWGYRRFATADSSTNISPIGIIIGGEELHNNHHAFASSAKFSQQWWEFDIGWFYIRLLSMLGLAKVKKVATKAIIVPGKSDLDLETVEAVTRHRGQVLYQYAQTVLSQVYSEEVRRLDARKQSVWKSTRSLLSRDESLLNTEAKARIEHMLGDSQTLQTVYEYRQRLRALWEERTATHERLLAQLEQWCREAEASGIRALQDFARSLRAYAMQPA